MGLPLQDGVALAGWGCPCRTGFGFGRAGGNCVVQRVDWPARACLSIADACFPAGCLRLGPIAWDSTQLGQAKGE
eukprot:359190-Chlamydomonas_euryale.AAC.3